jgi:hypothetical protein
MGKGRGKRVQQPRTGIYEVNRWRGIPANPNGNREQRRAAAKLARRQGRRG